MPQVHVILNPHARLNRSDTRERVSRLQQLVGRLGSVHCTYTLDDLRSTLRSLGASRDDYVVCDGGDGSLHWAVNTLIDQVGGLESEVPILVPARAGTIDFIATKAGIIGSPTRVVRELVTCLRRGSPPRLTTLDTLFVRGTQFDNGSVNDFCRVGFALAAGGVGARFFDKYYEERIRGRRAIAKIVSRALSSHLSDHAGLPLPQGFLHYGRDFFRPTRARVTIDGRELPVTEHGALHAGSIDVNFKGLLRVFPLAKTSGVLHFQAGSIVPRELIRNLPNLYRGQPMHLTGFTELGGTEMTISPLDGEVLNPVIDGERLTGIGHLNIRKGPTIRVPVLSPHAELK